MLTNWKLLYFSRIAAIATCLYMMGRLSIQDHSTVGARRNGLCRGVVLVQRCMDITDTDLGQTHTGPYR